MRTVKNHYSFVTLWWSKFFFNINKNEHFLSRSAIIFWRIGRWYQWNSIAAKTEIFKWSPMCLFSFTNINRQYVRSYVFWDALLLIFNLRPFVHLFPSTWKLKRIALKSWARFVITTTLPPPHHPAIIMNVVVLPCSRTCDPACYTFAYTTRARFVVFVVVFFVFDTAFVQWYRQLHFATTLRRRLSVSSCGVAVVSTTDRLP